MAKAVFWGIPDTEKRKPGERTGLETPVVLAVNDGCWVLADLTLSVPKLTR